MESSGIDRLDELLQGGLEERSNVALYGPPFCGKEVMSYMYIARSLAENIPAIFILTDKTSFDASSDLKRYNSDIDRHEEEGLLRYIDIYSLGVGITEKKHGVEYVDSPINTNAINMALNSVQRDLLTLGPKHRLAFSSLSTLTAYTNAAATFRFLQILCGRCKRAGATSIFTLEAGMHPDNEVQMFKHLMDGVIEFREDESNLKTYLRVQGVSGKVRTRDWVEYILEEDKLDILGSFALGRIH